ncbi:hypothetical protein [Phytohabitans houttuyneae]|uniref:Adhesin domain-containing protein n=1 Tax=Phytohabitans houttuyneae TaxID=1076126 RepID=A0A6V8KQV6_9ACTN|nr:hypothetical protein [Phytohabitans houttuyneae]GFJ86224.1 hypothetical protein Phou_104040 [Phytohabitans houttuyneae]
MAPSTRFLPLAVLASLALAACDTSAFETAEDLKSYDVPDAVTTVDLTGRSGSVEVSVADGPVRVQERRVYADLPPLTSHRVEGGTLYLLDRGCGKAADADGQCATHYRVDVPRGVAVTVKVGTAPVTVTGVTAALDVTTDVGAIKGSGLAGPVKATTSVGDVELRFAAAPRTVEVRNDVGATRVFLPAGDAYRIDARTDAGPVVDLPSRPDAPNAVTLRSSTGEITVSPA